MAMRKPSQVMPVFPDDGLVEVAGSFSPFAAATAAPAQSLCRSCGSISLRCNALASDWLATSDGTWNA